MKVCSHVLIAREDHNFGQTPGDKENMRLVSAPRVNFVAPASQAGVLPHAASLVMGGRGLHFRPLLSKNGELFASTSLTGLSGNWARFKTVNGVITQTDMTATGSMNQANRLLIRKDGTAAYRHTTQKDLDSAKLTTNWVEVPKPRTGRIVFGLATPLGNLTSVVIEGRAGHLHMVHFARTLEGTLVKVDEARATQLLAHPLNNVDFGR